ncbi:hypothetical protein FSST1_002554 [Fusarium sambucinum]
MHMTDEIWSFIFSHFEYPMPRKGWQNDDEWAKDGSKRIRPGRDELLALCLVNRQFRRIAQQLLYRSIPIETGYDKGSKSPFEFLVGILHNDRTLGRNIRALKVLGTQRNSDASTERALDDLKLESSLASCFKRCISHAGAPFLLMLMTPQVQLVDYTMTRAKPCIPWLLSGRADLKDKIKNLRRVATLMGDRPDSLREGVEVYSSPDQPNANQQAITNAPRNISEGFDPFPNLKEVRVRAEDIRKAFLPAWLIEPILLNPNVKTLRTFGVDWYMGKKRIVLWPKHRSNLECLDLQDTILNANALKSIMIRCPKLKSLSFEFADLYRKVERSNYLGHVGTSYHGGSGDDGNGYDGSHAGSSNYYDHSRDPIYYMAINLVEFGNILRKHGGNLEELSVSTFHFKNSNVFNHLEGHIGTLRELTNLKHVKIECFDLIGLKYPPFDDDDATIFLWDDCRLVNDRLSDVLPASIETLYLYNRARYVPLDYQAFKDIGGTQCFVKAFLAEAEICAPNLRKVTVEWLQSLFRCEKLGEKMRKEFCEMLCENYWSRETIDDGWDVEFVKEKFEVEHCHDGYEMTLVVLTKKNKTCN